MDKNIKKNKIFLKKKNLQNSKNDISIKIRHSMNFENSRKPKDKSQNKNHLINKKRVIKINSYSSSHDNKKKENLSRFKNKLEKKNKTKISLNSKKKVINNSLSIINKFTKSISKEKTNNLKTLKNNSKKIVNYHYSYFLHDFSEKYKKNLNSFNNGTSLSNIKNNSSTKTNSANKTKNIKINSNINNSKNKNNGNIKNIHNINNINRINIINKNKNKEIKNYYSINTFCFPYNISNINKSHSRINTSKNRFSSLSQKTSKEKKNFNIKHDKEKPLKNVEFTKQSKFIFESTNNSSSKNETKKKNIHNKKPINQKINSRNNGYINSNVESDKSSLLNIKNINNKINNCYELKNKNKRQSSKKRSSEIYNTLNHSPNNALEKKEFLNLLNISKIINENNKIKEKNENLSIQIRDMTREFENMKKENIIIKKELKEKSKMIKDMKLTIDIFSKNV